MSIYGLIPDRLPPTDHWRLISYSCYTHAPIAPETQEIHDFTETDLINMRRTIYLTIMNSLGNQEAVHKLLNVAIPEGKEVSVELLGLAVSSRTELTT